MRKALLLIAIYLLAASLIFSSLDLVKNELGNTSFGAVILKKFSSYEELKNFVKVYNNSWYWAGELALAGNAAEYSPRDYSTTNVQVEGVDEADIVKSDGKYLYIVSAKNIVIVEAYPTENATIVAQINLTGVVRGIFINGDKLVVFEAEHGYKIFYVPYKQLRTFIKVYDISTRTNPILVRNVSITGWYFNSRMIGEYVYVVVEQHLYWESDEIILPKIYSNENAKTIPAAEIYYCNVSDYSYTFTTIVAVNVQNDEQAPSYLTVLLGSASNLYVSLENIYIAVHKWQTTEATLLYRIHLEGAELELVANGEVPGRVLNQFSMDEYNGYLRIATTTGNVARIWGEATSENNIYVLDLSLNTVGSLTNLAHGERIYSARFMGDRCYLVTFRQIDPFFVIDLKDPSSPKVLGELKIPGFSSYLHPYDEDHIIGIGKEEANVKISFFDICNVTNPKEIDKYLVNGEWSDSMVLRDHKAFLFDKSKNLLVIPVSKGSIGVNKYSAWQGVYVLNISLEGGIRLKGMITHLENDTVRWYFSPYFVKRSLYIDNLLYTVSDKKLKMNSLEDLEELNELELPYSEDYIY